ncbi:Anaerobic dimethyl sulfoxide reductase chain A [Altererythrobacter epoxidivorans]|uniref:Anaerobic dimethyl sulfoxide reductase chain A n=1 Tax=Altererythrobacter epoxidivorans TaxID=361183 RepID=A0A0M4MFR7_9SPHN|nr:molybdopterin oxidoreductase family protein [Altererythrobacter epoxidivorans]ALE16093.1 Anaerobic dimethyl sulfoxide reductase chain A [Altererythrobacter epoxidivorans]
MGLNPFETVTEEAALSPEVSDEVKTSTCYMCACRCGIKVHLKSGKIRYIEGNPDHPVNKGVLCAKGSAGIMHQYSPAKLTKPLLRVGERGSGEFKEIEWDEALSLATDWLGELRNRDPGKLAFFTGRDQSQSLTGWWATQFGTHNFAAHGGFCSVNMAAGGLYTLGGAFWEFGEPDFERTKYLVMLGVADDHDSNPIKLGLGNLKTRPGTKFVSVNPVRTGYSAIADEWVGIRPGTDGLFLFAIIHELLRAEKIDFPYLARYSNAPWLVIREDGAPDDGLFLRDENGAPLLWDLADSSAKAATGGDASPAFAGEREVMGRKVVPSFQYLAERYLDAQYSPEAVAETTGVPADVTRRIAAELAEVAFEQELVIEQPWTDAWGRKHDKMVGRPVSFHAMRGISAHSNGFHTCRAIHILQALLGSVDVPGGWRYKAPFPKPVPPGIKPAWPKAEAATPLSGPPLGFPRGPEDLIVDQYGEPLRIDKAYSWEHPLALHGLMHMVLHNAATQDPYGIDVLFMFMANMAWNSSMNIPKTLGYFTAKRDDGEYVIPKIIYSDAFWSETVPYCDLILPDTTYLERWDCISMLDRPISSAHGAGDSIRQPVVPLDRDVRPFQTVLLDLGARLGLPGMVNNDGSPKYPGGYSDYIVNHERSPGIGPLSGWRGENGEKSGVGAVNPDQLERYIENGCFWSEELPHSAQYFKFANREYLDYAKSMGWLGHADPIAFHLYNEDLQRFRLAARGHGEIQPPPAHRERIETYFDPLPIWYQPFLEADEGGEEFPVHALSQRPMHMYHSWGSQNAWLRQITSANKLHLHRNLAAKHELADDDWVWIENGRGRVKAQVKLVTGVNENVVWTWNAIGKRKGAWGLDKDSPEFTRGFLLNHIITEMLLPKKGDKAYSNSDPVTGQAAWYDLRVRLRKCSPAEAGETEPMFEPVAKRFSGQDGPLEFGDDLKGDDTGGKSPLRDFIGQRSANHSWVEGIRDGRGNRVREDT